MSALKVFYVDDDPDIREVASLSLELDEGIEVRTAGSAAEALTLLDAGGWQPDVLLLDVMMPVMDGPGLLKEIRTREAFVDTPVIFITARAQPHEKAQFIAAGGVGIIPKPFDPISLAKDVRAILSQL